MSDPDNISDTKESSSPKKEDNLPKYVNLVLGSGSTRGICHVGSIKKLVDAKLLDLDSIKSIAGTSAGSLLAVLIAIGFNIDQIWDFLLCLDISAMVNPDPMLLVGKCGLDRGKIFYDLFENIIAEKTKIKHINFSQLYDITKKHLIIVGSCLTTKKAVYFDHINTPHFKVSMALRISIGMPIFFTPVTIDGITYIDGAILDHYPISLFEDDLDRTIGISITDEFSTKFDHPEEYFVAILNLMMHKFYLMENLYEKNTIYINVPKDNSNIFDFGLSQSDKIKLYQLGYSECENFIANYL